MSTVKMDAASPTVFLSPRRDLKRRLRIVSAMEEGRAEVLMEPDALFAALRPLEDGGDIGGLIEA